MQWTSQWGSDWPWPTATARSSLRWSSRRRYGKETDSEGRQIAAPARNPERPSQKRQKHTRGRKENETLLKRPDGMGDAGGRCSPSVLKAALPNPTHTRIHALRESERERERANDEGKETTAPAIALAARLLYSPSTANCKAPGPSASPMRRAKSYRVGRGCIRHRALLNTVGGPAAGTPWQRIPKIATPAKSIRQILIAPPSNPVPRWHRQAEVAPRNVMTVLATTTSRPPTEKLPNTNAGCKGSHQPGHKLQRAHASASQHRGRCKCRGLRRRMLLLLLLLQGHRLMRSV